jgi:hypothetical protein
VGNVAEAGPEYMNLNAAANTSPAMIQFSARAAQHSVTAQHHSTASQHSVTAQCAKGSTASRNAQTTSSIAHTTPNTQAIPLIASCATLTLADTVSLWGAGIGCVEDGL